MVSFLKNNLIILIIILILGSYLGVKALDENGWDGWGFGSAQTLMTIEYWVKDGFAKNYFLFIPSPYSKLIQHFDEPEFRKRPIDESGGVLPRDQRLYYTHYPPLYIFPYALIRKINLENRSVFRIFSILISLTGLLFFYWFIKSISNKVVAAIAAIYYGFSVTFLNYADSISVQPWDILFIFLILYLSVLAWRLSAQAGGFVSLRDISRREKNQKKYQNYNVLIWFAYFALSLLSYDATFFIFAYLVLFDILILKKFLLKKWLVLALAPMLGFALQIIQNTWYLGLQDMIGDFSRSYANRTFIGVKSFIAGLIGPFVTMTSLKTVFIFKKTIVTLTSAVTIFGILWKFKQRIGLNSDYFKIAFVLAIAAVVQPLFINATGGWPFAGVLAASFFGLLIGAASIFITNVFRHKESRVYKTISFGILTAVVLMLWSTQFYSTLNYVKDWPNNRPDQKVIEFGKTIKNIEPGKEKIAFRIIPKNIIWRSHFFTFNFEYYLGMPKVDLANTRDLLADFFWFRDRSEYPFYSFVITEDKIDAEKIRRELIAKNIKNISPIIEIQSQYLFTVGPKQTD